MSISSLSSVVVVTAVVMVVLVSVWLVMVLIWSQLAFLVFCTCLALLFDFSIFPCSLSLKLIALSSLFLLITDDCSNFFLLSCFFVCDFVILLFSRSSFFLAVSLIMAEVVSVFSALGSDFSDLTSESSTSFLLAALECLET